MCVCVCVCVCVLENHRFDTDHEDSLITKTCLFQFINAFFSLFYIGVCLFTLVMLSRSTTIFLRFRVERGKSEAIVLHSWFLVLCVCSMHLVDHWVSLCVHGPRLSPLAPTPRAAFLKNNITVYGRPTHCKMLVAGETFVDTDCFGELCVSPLLCHMCFSHTNRHPFAQRHASIAPRIYLPAHSHGDARIYLSPQSQGAAPASVHNSWSFLTRWAPPPPSHTHAGCALAMCSGSQLGIILVTKIVLGNTIEFFQPIIKSGVKKFLTLVKVCGWFSRSHVWPAGVCIPSVDTRTFLRSCCYRCGSSHLPSHLPLPTPTCAGAPRCVFLTVAAVRRVASFCARVVTAAKGWR